MDRQMNSWRDVFDGWIDGGLERWIDGWDRMDGIRWMDVV